MLIASFIDSLNEGELFFFRIWEQYVFLRRTLYLDDVIIGKILITYRFYFGINQSLLRQNLEDICSNN